MFLYPPEITSLSSNWANVLFHFGVVIFVSLGGLNRNKILSELFGECLMLE